MGSTGFELQVGERLKTARERKKRQYGKKFTQDAVARRCKVDPKTYRAWEKGESMPSEVELLGLAALFDVTYGWLVGTDHGLLASNSFAA